MELPRYDKTGKYDAFIKNFASLEEFYLWVGPNNALKANIIVFMGLSLEFGNFLCKYTARLT